MNAGKRSLRPAGLVGLAWGTALLVRGPQLFRAVQGRAPVEGERIALVALGVRHAGQGVLQVLLPHQLAGLYAAVDALHAASMGAMAVRSPQRRRAVLVSGTVAAVAGLASLRSRS